MPVIFRLDEGTPEGQGKLSSYLLADCEADPNGETAFQRNQPVNTVYLNGIGVRQDALGLGLGVELTDDLLALADKRSTFASVKASNFNMMGLVSRIGKNFQDPEYNEGAYAGRSRCIELLYWYNYFRDMPDGNRVMTVYNPGIFIPDSIAMVNREHDIVDPKQVADCIKGGRERIAFYNKPAHNKRRSWITEYCVISVFCVF